MPQPLEDYAIIGDCQTAALVGVDGSIDWLCFPRFDSGACFAALLGDEENGRWKIAPTQEVRRRSRRYRPGTLLLETDFETETGAARVTDFMPPRDETPDLVRVVEGRRGTVRMRMELVIRFDYGSIIPWVQRITGGVSAIAGPDMVRLRDRRPAPRRELPDGRRVRSPRGRAGQLRPDLVPLQRAEPRASSTTPRPSTTPSAGGASGPTAAPSAMAPATGRPTNSDGPTRSSGR